MVDAQGSARFVKTLLCVSLLSGADRPSLAAVEAGAQSPEGPSFTVDQIKAFYSDVFLPSRTNRGSVSVDLAALPDDHPLAALVSKNDQDRKSTRLNSSHPVLSRMPSSA